MHRNFENGIDIFITKLSSDGSQILASTLHGGIKMMELIMMESRFCIMDKTLYYNYADGARMK